VLARPHIARFLGSLALMRLGASMYGLAVILFALERYHSPVWAGLLAAFSYLPGLLLGPIAGALLDRYGRVRLVALDMAVAASTIVAIVALARLGQLTAPVMLVVVTLGALTVPLTTGGVRSLLPLLLPREQWDRGNALDSVITAGTVVAGPALAGVLYATAGGLITLVVIGLLWLLAGLLILTVREPDVPAPTGSGLVGQAWAGVRYLFANPTLRALSLVLPVANTGEGFLQVALPVAVLAWPRGGPLLVGTLWALSGVAAVAASLGLGLFRTDARERAIMTGGLVLTAAGAGLLTLAGGPLPAAVAMVLIGISFGGFDVAFFSLRQRVTDPAWLGRTMTLSVSINGLGRPAGSAAAGPLVALSPVAGLGLGACLYLAAAVACVLTVPRRSPD
jgi:MFS family permease